MELSARNQLPGTVSNVTLGGVMAEVEIDLGSSPYLLAWEEDGQPLTGTAGPVRLVTPGDVRGGRYVTGVVTIEVRDVDSEPRAV